MRKIRLNYTEVDMYEIFMQTLRTFMGFGALRCALSAAIIFIILGLITYAAPSFREMINEYRKGKGWKGILAGCGTGLFKFMLIFFMARFFMVALIYQAGEFERRHGRVTGTNRSAVLMKWGHPHEQNELNVAHYRERVWVTRQLCLREKDKDDKIFSDSFWKDEEQPVQAVNGKIPDLLSTREETRSVSVEQKSITSADISVVLKDNPRTLGNANYAGYNDEWQFKYEVANRSLWKTTAYLSFPLPAKNGLFDEMYFRIDGKDVLDYVKTSDNNLLVSADMPPESVCLAEIGYKSRGLEHIRYIPDRMSRTGHYRVDMTVHGIKPAELDYPIGSMPPAEKLDDVSGDPYTLHWKLDNALTSYDIGIKLPVAKQPAYHFSNLLGESPIGVVILILLLVIPRLILCSPVRPDVVGIMCCAYSLHFTFMGRLADITGGFDVPFSVSAIILTVVMVWFRFRDRDWKLLNWMDSAAFVIVAVLFPMAVVDSAMTDFWMQCIYVGLLVFTCILLAGRYAGRRIA